MGIFGSILGGLGGALLAPFTGGLSIGVGAGIGDSIENSRDAKKANAQKMGLYNEQMALAQQQLQFQQDYVKNRLQWQVEDAKKAGLHPMVAAGLSPTSFSPVSAPSIPDMSSVASELGQNLDYAVTKAKTQKQQAEALAFMRESNRLDLEGKHLDNELKQMEIMSMLSRLSNSGPASPPVGGQDPLSLIGGQEDAVSPKSDAFSVRHIRDNDYDINYTADYQQELGDEFGQAYNMLRKASREFGSVWTDPKTGAAYVFNRDSGFWNRLDALSVEEAERLLGKPSHSGSGLRPLSSSHFMRNRYRYRY